MMSINTSQCLLRHSREGGNPASHLVPSTQTDDFAPHDQQTGFPLTTRGNDVTQWDSQFRTQRGAL